MKSFFKLRRRLGNTIEGAVFFGIFAPPTGSIPVSAALSIYHLYAYRGDDNHAVYTIITFVGLALLSYVFGAIPALLVGAIAGFSRHRQGKKARATAAAILGGILSVGFAVSLGLPQVDQVGILMICGFFLIPGIFGAAVIAVQFFHLDDKLQSPLR